MKLLRVSEGGDGREKEEKPAGEERKRRRPVGSKNTKKPCSEKVEGGELAGCADMGGLQFFTTQIESADGENPVFVSQVFCIHLCEKLSSGLVSLTDTEVIDRLKLHMQYTDGEPSQSKMLTTCITLSLTPHNS